MFTECTENEKLARGLRALFVNELVAELQHFGTSTMPPPVGVLFPHYEWAARTNKWLKSCEAQDINSVLFT